LAVDTLVSLLTIAAIVLCAAFLRGRRKMKEQGTWMGQSGVIAATLWKKASHIERLLMLTAAGITQKSQQEVYAAQRWISLPHPLQIQISRTLEEIRNEQAI
jgi:hypothetical protein